MTIKTRIISTLTLLFILMLIISSYGPIVNMIRSSAVEDALLEGKIVEIQHISEKSRGQLALALQHFPKFEYAVLHTHPTENHLKLIEENMALIQSHWDDYYNQIKDTEEKKLADAWYAKSEAFSRPHFVNALNSIRKDNWDTAEKLLIGKIAQSYAAGSAASQELSAYIAKRLNDGNARVASQTRLANMALLGAVILAVIISIISAFTLIRNIIVPLNRAVGITERISQGDLTQTVAVGSNDEIGRMMFAIRDMNDSLTGMVRQVRTDADAIAAASVQIAAGNMDLSNRTEQQAAALGETANSVDMMTQAVRENTEKARNANNLTQESSLIATEAGNVVSEVVGTMNEINAASHKIVDIISVIDGIAFQTNILALNAAVEAARAGEQGRGFAVVATEVRSLAQRSAAAAREIKELIDNSVEKVDLGSELVNRAGDIMERVVSSIQEVNALMNEIATGSQEQASGIEQINTAVSHMDQATQQNAALVEQAAAAAQSMSENANGLKRMVGVFQLSEENSNQSSPLLLAQG